MLVDMIRRREKTKAALIEFDAEIFAKRMQLADFGSSIYNQVMSKMRFGDKTTATTSTTSNGSKTDTVSNFITFFPIVPYSLYIF